MYEAFYGMKKKPFSILPDPDLVYWGRTHSMAFAVLEYAVTNNVGLTVVTGEIGSGKTTLLRCLLAAPRPKFHDRAGIQHAARRGRPVAVDHVVLSPSFRRGNARPDQATSGLCARPACERASHHADHRRGAKSRAGALETLRMLCNVNTEKHQLLQIILVGQPQLRDALHSPQLLQFAQRVTSDFHLRQLPQGDVANYINYRVGAVGASEQLFLPEACQAIAEASAGIPRVINMLCDTSLVYGFASGARNIPHELVREVIEDKNNFGIFPVCGRVALAGCER